MYELLYTSAPNTLDGEGYGAVGRSNQFPVRLEKFIRQHLNQYDFEPGERADTSSRGAIFCYSRLEDMGQIWHILSRVGFGGHDYTQRAVFLAHHVALDDEEFANGNAAALMLDPSLLWSRWDGRVGTLSDRPAPACKPAGNPSATWQALAGDPKWAQVFVDRWQQRKGVPQFLIVPDPTATLSLFAEAEAVLDSHPSERATFLNNLTSARSGIQWDWIGLAAESEISGSVAARFPDRVFDLRRPLGRAASAPRRRTPTQAVAVAPKTKVAADPSVATPALPSPPDPWDQLVSEETEKLSAKRTQTSESPAMRPPPPPPPAGWKSRRWLLVTVAAGIGFSAAGGWGLHTMFSLSAPQPQPVTQLSKPDNHDKDDKPAASPAPQPAPAVAPSAPETPMPPQQGTTQPPTEPLFGPTQPSEPPADESYSAWRNFKPVTQFVEKSLRTSIEEQGEDKSATVIDLAAVKLPKEPGLKLISPKALKLDFTPAPTPFERNSAIKVTLAEQPDEAAALFHLEDLSLMCDCTGKDDAKAELLNRLQFCVLEVAGSNDGLSFDKTVRVAFTPRLPALSLSRARQDSSADASNAAAFCSAAGPLNVALKLRVERLSLSVLPRENRGWMWATSNELSWLAPKGLLNKFTVGSAEQSDAHAVQVEVSFGNGGSDSSKPPISRKFEINPSPVPGKSKVASDADLIRQMFDRFGELHGVIVVDVDGHGVNGHEEIELLRFGSPQFLE